MIDIKNFDDTPMITGDSKEFTIQGDGPFFVSSRCFVDKPRPPGPGFLPCAECTKRTVIAGETVVIHSSKDIWKGREGHIDIHIENMSGESRDLQIIVLSDSSSAPLTMTNG